MKIRNPKGKLGLSNINFQVPNSARQRDLNDEVLKARPLRQNHLENVMETW